MHYYGDEVLDIDLLALKKYKNLTSISLPENISENTKLQISELETLEYVNKWDMVISNEEDFEHIKDLPNLKYIAVASNSDAQITLSFYTRMKVLNGSDLINLLQMSK